MAMRQKRTIDEQILYRLSLDFRSHELAEALLDRLRCLVGDLPARESHHHSHPGGLYQHSLEVALRTLKEFAGTTITERLPDGQRGQLRKLSKQTPLAVRHVYRGALS
jgi:hypothetical protein